MDEKDKRLLTVLQADVPLVSRPFLALGKSLGLAETEVLHRLELLKQRHILRQISAIFDTRSLGYKSTLVAMRVPAERLEQAAQVVNAHPGVSHNYQRENAFNLWFTLAVPSTSDLEWTVQRLHVLSRADSTRVLPTLRLFKIGVQLDLEAKADSGMERLEAAYSDVRRPPAGRAGLTPADITVIRELQEDFPLIPEPYRPMGERIGLDEEGLFTIARRLQAEGYLRRIAAVLHHRDAGFRENAMGVWVVPSERTQEVGETMASFRAVSHCYLRPTYPDWPYNIFTMVHGQKAADCHEIIAAISRATGITDYALLYSTKEYKKVRLKYFPPALDEWEAHARQSGGPIPEEAGALMADQH